MTDEPVEWVGYVAADQEPLVVGPIKLERKKALLWVGWLGGWRVSISNANPPPLEGDLAYRGPWRVRLGQRRTNVRMLDEGVACLVGWMSEIDAAAAWFKLRRLG